FPDFVKTGIEAVLIDPDLGRFDLARLGAFFSGWRGEAGGTPEMVKVIPDLMVEALIAETIAPIAATGTFGGLDAGEFLAMALRKADWLRANAGEVVRAASGERQAC
ncbi:MAG TPA: hypothetical protein PLU35_06495, partial [Phycisphaerales bacterium]|nr:hypothetical protein [Phycisphaerales bacterium]